MQSEDGGIADMDWQASLTPVRQARPVSRTGKRKSPAQHRTPVDESVIDLCDEDGAAGPGASATSSSFMHAHGRSTALTGRGQQANFGAKRQHNSRTTEQSIAQAGAGGSQQETSRQQRGSSARAAARSPRQVLKAARAAAQQGGCIDLVDVTDVGVMALEAADQRVESASNDSALARALADKEAVEQQLKEALAAAQASQSSAPLRAPMPSHWAPMLQDVPVQYVELPLPPECSPATGDVQTMRASTPPLDESTLKAMEYQGLSRADAEAALAHCSGDGDEALLYAVQCIPKGGAAACADDNDDAAVAAEKLARRQQAELVEAQQVLARFTANNPAIRHSNVVRIERVQNPHLWTKYCLRRHEMELAAGSACLNEQLLFHGCRKDVMDVITKEGFDIRVAAMAGSLGVGTYFAGNSNYSMAYLERGPRIAALPPVPSIPFGQTPSFGQNPGFGGFGSSMALNPTSNMAAAPFAAPGSNFGNILPNPSTHGVLASKKKKSPKSRSSRAASPHSSAQNHDHVRSQPGFIRDAKAMLVCRVSLGRLAIGGHSLRLPPKGFDAVTIAGGEVFPQALVAAIFAVFDNSQGYPEYIVHFHPQ